MNKKRRLILDIIGLFFSIISIFIFTIYFGLFNISIKYIFLIGYVLAFILLSNCIKSLEYNLNTNIYKYSKCNIENKYIKKFGLVKYGMITYDNERMQCQRYYCLYEKEIEGFEKIKIPSTKWLRFRINSQNPKDIQGMSHRFYRQFLPSVKYNLKELPELEYYHDNVTDFLIAIY